MKTYADKKQDNKNQSIANDVYQKRSSDESTFQFVDNRPEAITQRKLQNIIDSSTQAKKITQLQAIANTHTVQRFPFDKDGNDLSAVSGFKDGMKSATIDRLRPPSLRVGSMLSFELITSALITPFLSESPAIPSQFKPYTYGFLGGSISGTIARNFFLRKMRVPIIIDTLMTASNINETAVKIDDYLNANPKLKPKAQTFTSEVMHQASKQHKRTNPFMTPNLPESSAEIQSLF